MHVTQANQGHYITRLVLEGETMQRSASLTLPKGYQKVCKILQTSTILHVQLENFMLIQQIFITLLSRNFCLNCGSLLRFLSKQMQYPRKNVPHMPATIPAINLELIFKTVIKVENKKILHTTRRKLLQIRSRCADCAAAQSEYLPSLLCAFVERLWMRHIHKGLR